MELNEIKTINANLTIGEMQQMYEKYGIQDYDDTGKKIDIAGGHNVVTAQLLSIIKFYEERERDRVNCAKCKELLSEMRRIYLVEIDYESGDAKASIEEILDLWDRVNKFLKIKTLGDENNEQRN